MTKKAKDLLVIVTVFLFFMAPFFAAGVETFIPPEKPAMRYVFYFVIFIGMFSWIPVAVIDPPVEKIERKKKPQINVKKFTKCRYCGASEFDVRGRCTSCGAPQ